MRLISSQSSGQSPITSILKSNKSNWFLAFKMGTSLAVLCNSVLNDMSRLISSWVSPCRSFISSYSVYTYASSVCTCYFSFLAVSSSNVSVCCSSLCWRSSVSFCSSLSCSWDSSTGSWNPWGGWLSRRVGVVNSAFRFGFLEGLRLEFMSTTLLSSSEEPEPLEDSPSLDSSSIGVF